MARAVPNKIVVTRAAAAVIEPADEIVITDEQPS